LLDVLQNDSDAEMHLKATFLVLARKKRIDPARETRLRPVTRRLPSRRQQLAQRIMRRHAARNAHGAGRSRTTTRHTWREALTILHEESAPAGQLKARLFCYLEGKAHNEGAQQLDWSRRPFRPTGTRSQDVAERLTSAASPFRERSCPLFWRENGVSAFASSLVEAALAGESARGERRLTFVSCQRSNARHVL